jgi:hypothetical protein
MSVYLCKRCLQVAGRAHVDLRRVVTRTVRRVIRLLPFPDQGAALYFKVGDIELARHVETTGVSHARFGTVALPSSPKLLRELDYWLPTVAHEMNHMSRSETASTGLTLIDQMITEGLAIAFEKQVFPTDRIEGVDEALTAEQEHRIWDAAKARLDRLILGDEAFLRWFFGTADLPNATGYAIGYHIVKSYLEHHPGATAAKIAALPSDEILAGSHYDP